MKKIIILSTIIAAMSIASCQKPEDASPVSPARTDISFSLSDNQTKTNLVGVNTLVWSNGDALSIYDSESSSYKTFTLSSGAGTNEATFSIAESVTIGNSATAFYPETMTPGYDTYYTVKLPASYTWSDSGVKAPMIGWVNQTDPYMSMMTGVIKIDVYNIPSSAKKLVFKTLNGKKVSGSFTLVSTEDDTKNTIATVATETAADQMITIDFSTEEYAASRTFFIPVPSGEYTFSVQMLASADAAIDGTLKKLTVSTLSVAAKKIVYAPAISFGSYSYTLLNSNTEKNAWDAISFTNNDLSTATGGAYTTWDALPEGTRIKVTHSDVSGEILFQDNDSWSTRHLCKLSETGVTETTFRASSFCSLKGALNIKANVGITFSKVEILSPAAEKVIWVGARSGDVSDLTVGAYFSGISAGKILTVYYTERAAKDTWANLYFKDKTNWKWYFNGSHHSLGAGVEDCASFTIAESVSGEDDATFNPVSILSSGGLYIGSDLTITKITLR